MKKMTQKNLTDGGNFPTPAFLSNFAYLEPYQTTTYTSVFVNDDDWRFQSLTNLDGSFFVGAGGFHFLLRDVSASYPANNIYSGGPALCPKDDVLKVAIIDDAIQNVFSLPLPPPSGTSASYSGYPPLQVYSLSIRCLSN